MDPATVLFAALGLGYLLAALGLLFAGRSWGEARGEGERAVLAERNERLRAEREKRKAAWAGLQAFYDSALSAGVPPDPALHSVLFDGVEFEPAGDSGPSSPEADDEARDVGGLASGPHDDPAHG